jgi:hypothetical protein
MKQIKVLNHPETFILIDDNKDEEQERVIWQKKYKGKKELPDEQKRREAISIRQGKVEQRKYYK